MMDSGLARYNWYMSAGAGQWRYGDLTDAAMAGYKTEGGAIQFLIEVQEYLIATAIDENCKPNWRERLTRRARLHNCELEFKQIVADFRIEWNIHAYFANESTEEFEFNHRRDM